MERFEANIGNPEPNPEAPRTKLDIADQRVQMVLALYVYKAEHPGLEWSDATKREALNEWIGDPNSPDTLAARYRTYVEAHPYELIDVENSSAIAVLSGNIRRTEGETLH